MSGIIAITGATGFAGRHAVAELLAEGYEVRALVRDPATANLDQAIQTIRGDLENGAALDRLLEGAAAVVHLAGAITALTVQDYFKVNAHGTMALAEAALRQRVKRFVHISSLSARMPSLSPYGASKRAGEDAVAERGEELNAVIIRPPAVYGPGDRGTLPLIKELTRGIATIPGPPQARFSLIHAGDLARIIVRAIQGKEKNIHEVSDGTPGGYSWSHLLRVAALARGKKVRAIFLPKFIPAGIAVAAETISIFTGRPGMINRGKVAELYHSDWVCREGTMTVYDPVTFETGFPETLEWYRNAGWLPRVAAADTTNASN
jgi:nucleoside-diphosphate-sugar epimerase